MTDVTANRASRDAVIEFYRCLCILGVIFLHAITWGPFATDRGFANIGNTGVIGFVLISARFGIHFKLSKVFRIVGVAFFSSVVAYLICENFQPEGLIVGAWRFACSCWGIVRILSRIQGERIILV